MFRTNSKSIAITSVFIALFFILAIGGIHSVHALSFPAGITNYVALNISNSQTSATPNPFQQMISVTSSDSGWTYINTNQTTAFGENVEFFYSNGTIIPSWLESYTSGHAIWWVKTGSIAANSKLTIYMGFASKTTNLFNTNDVGEAPQLSSTYAEYDNGANIFDLYINGNTPTSDFTISSGSGTISQTTSTFSNGQTINVLKFALGSGGTGAFAYYNVNTLPHSNYIFETSTASDGSDYAGIYSLADTDTASNNAIGVETQYGTDYVSLNWVSSGTITGPYDIQGSQTSAWRYFWMTATTSGSTYIGASAPQLYSTSGGYSITSSANPYSSITSNVYLVIWQGGGYWLINWLRVRAYPPNGVMPSVSFGSVQQVVAITLYLNGVSNANVTITYGTESNFTAVISPSTDYVSLYVNGTKVASLTQGKAVYLKTLAAGLYKVTAATNASGVSNQTYYEKINKASDYLSLSSSPNINYTYNGTKANITAKVLSDLNNQLKNITFKVNNMTVKTFNSTGTASYSNAVAGTYTAVINSSGNQNYSSETLKLTIVISKANPLTAYYLFKTEAGLKNVTAYTTEPLSNMITSNAVNNLSVSFYVEYPNGTLSKWQTGYIDKQGNISFADFVSRAVYHCGVCACYCI